MSHSVRQYMNQPTNYYVCGTTLSIRTISMTLLNRLATSTIYTTHPNNVNVVSHTKRRPSVDVLIQATITHGSVTTL